MAEASLTYKTFKLGFQGGKLTCNSGTDVSFSADATTATTLATIIGQTASVDNVKTCLKYGASVAAVCVAGKIIHQAWSWITPSSVKPAGELEVAIDPGQNDNFQKLLDSGELSRTVKEGFGNLGIKLKALLGKEVFDQVGTEVLNVIGGFRVDSVQVNGPDLPKDLIARNVFRGKVDQKIINKHEFMAVKKPKGPVIGMLVDSGANVKQEIYGGGEMMVVGYEDDDFKRVLDAHQNLAGGDILVKILVKETEKTFTRKFKPATTMDEVILALKREEKKFYHIFRGDTELSGDLTMAQAAQDGSTVNWKAVSDQNLADGYIPVKIFVNETAKTFERNFKPATTIDEVILALKKKEKIFYSIFRGDTELSGDLTLAQAAQDGSTVNWTAKQ